MKKYVKNFLLWILKSEFKNIEVELHRQDEQINEIRSIIENIKQELLIARNQFEVEKNKLNDLLHNLDVGIDIDINTDSLQVLGQ